MNGLKKLFTISGLCLTSIFAHAQLSSQYIGTQGYIITQLDKVIKKGSIVHVYKAIDGVIYPPEYDGTPHTNNVLLDVARIGDGVDPLIIKEGKFSLGFSPKPLGSFIFVRVFHKGFYGDSQLFQIPTTKHETFMVEIKIDKPLDERDNDGDGLHNSWEITYGTDSEIIDSDDDGYTDLEEICLKTNPIDSQDYLSIDYSVIIPNAGLFVLWDAKGGVEYLVEHTTNYLDDENITWNLIDRNHNGFILIPNENDFETIRLRVECD